MNRLLSPNMVQPNLPLRKPSSSPMAVSAPALRRLSGPGAAASLGSASGATGDGLVHPLVIRNNSGVLGSEPPALTVYFCNFCGHQGNFRCTRCKKTAYCSVVCQTEDWKVHRHTCKAVDPEPAKAKPKEIPASPVTGDQGGQLELKHADAPSLQRVYLKDLNMRKAVMGTEIKASVVEFHSPGRFYLLSQAPELMEALKVISVELQKAYSCPSATTYVPCDGEVCGVQFSSDLNWYRGLVQTLSPDQMTAKILYIDFGNEECVPVTRIRPLSANIQPFSPCAMECRIAGVLPLATNWSSECCVAVRQLLAGKTVTVKLVETVENSCIHVVDIQLSMGTTLSMFLLEQGYAAEEPVDAAPTQQEISVMMSASLENFKRQSSGKDDNTWAHPPEPLTQAVGDSFFVVVIDFRSPTDIILQKVEHAGVIQELQLNLREYCAQVPAPQNFRPAPGTVCCAQFTEDKQWYRAKVLAYPSEERVCVGYVDFGNSEEVELGHLRPISTSLLALPMQAMPCGLAGVQPVGESWSDDCLLALRRRVSNRILRVEIQRADKGKASVAIIDEASDPQANIAELLISAGYAAPAPVATTSSDQQVDQTPSASPEPPVSTPASEPLVWSFPEIPCDGQTVALLPSVLENPGEFYCRLDKPADHQRLIDLGAELKQHCEAENSLFEPKVGEPCCAVFRGDGAWYRAMVKELCENQVSVNIADYGYSMKVERHQLRSITQRLLALPFQAVCCWLSGVEPPGSEWSSEAILWFQTLVDGELLSARVLSVTEQGYGVELMSKGQNVADALISEQLAKVPGEVPKETHVKTGSEAKYPESAAQNELNQIRAQASNQAGATSKEIPAEEQTAVPSEVPSFPVDWKTMELPLNETFKPCIAAVANPSLFYLLAPTLVVDQQMLQRLMMDVAAYCKNNQASLSSAVPSRPGPGAACCVQYSADSNWYRAVVLEAGEKELSVIYADYGNTEKVPSSRILPIPGHLLQLPFQITRCTLDGQEHFPVVWHEEVLQLFKTVLSNDVLATALSFDGSANVLSLTLPAERGGGQVAAMIVEALQFLTKTNPSPGTTQRAEQTDSSTPPVSSTAEPECPQPKSPPEHTAAASGSTITSEPTPLTRQQIIKTHEESDSDPRTSGCCCASLKTKMDHLEQLMQLHISLMGQLIGQKK
ncbi:tudor domain-containing protein 1 isoform X1 [Platichthys flesus]|uniref:tudor domain-containing protein 1 isoform X1 n=1 Tax=Platichthys flesus TaxID=8260 RepID=UPI002DBC7383|nr:tudor domain-containing protein 1 isoform X1 [Platichthys flesus]